jgi:hypothetical protein
MPRMDHWNDGIDCEDYNDDHPFLEQGHSFFPRINGGEDDQMRLMGVQNCAKICENRWGGRSAVFLLFLEYIRAWKNAKKHTNVIILLP